LLDNEREREREREKLLWGNEIRVNSSEAFSGISRVPLNERQARGIECTVIDPEKRNLPAILKCAMAAFSCTVIMWNNTREKKKERGGGRERERERRAMCCGIGILKNSKGPFPVFASGRRFTSNYYPVPSPVPSMSPPSPSRQRLMRGMQFPQTLARLSSGAPFPYVPTISLAPTCAFVLIRSGWIREEILRRRRILNSRKCVGNPIIFERSRSREVKSPGQICSIDQIGRIKDVYIRKKWIELNNQQ